MQIQELVKVGKYLSAYLKETNLPNLYKQLINAINKAAQDQSPGEVQSLLNQIRTVHKNAENQILSPAQNRLLIEYGAKDLLGEPALNEIEKILNKHQAHPQGLTNSFTHLMQKTNELNNKANNLISVLEPLFSTLNISENDIPEGEGRIWLYFSENVAIKDIEDLEKASETWKQIIHNFSRMPGAQADGGRIIHIQQKSPLEIELAANIALLTPLAFGINWVLGRVEQVIRILQEAENLKTLKVKNKIIEDLRKEAEELKESIAEEAANEIKKECNTDNEARNAAQQALTKIIKFIEGGGQLDIDTGNHEDESNTEENNQNNKPKILSLIKSIRSEMKNLPPPDSRVSEHKNNDDK